MRGTDWRSLGGTMNWEWEDWFPPPSVVAAAAGGGGDIGGTSQVPNVEFACSYIHTNIYMSDI